MALVTGAARPRGIGRATALRLARAGADVACVDIARPYDDAPAHGTATPTTSPAWWPRSRPWGAGRRRARADISEADQVEAAVPRPPTPSVRSPLVANVAGGSGPGFGLGPLVSVPAGVPPGPRRQRHRHLAGFAGVRQPDVRRRPPGRICNVSSQAGKRAFPMLGAYCAAKAGGHPAHPDAWPPRVRAGRESRSTPSARARWTPIWSTRTACSSSSLAAAEAWPAFIDGRSRSAGCRARRISRPRSAGCSPTMPPGSPARRQRQRRTDDGVTRVVSRSIPPRIPTRDDVAEQTPSLGDVHDAPSGRSGSVAVGWGPLPVAGVALESVAVVGFLVVVEVAEPGQGVEFGGVGVGPAVDVVDLEVAGDRVAGHDAVAVADFEGGALVGGDGSAEVGDGVDVDAVGDDRGEGGVGHHGFGHGDGHRADAGDLAGFAGQRVAADHGGVVDDDRRGGGRPHRLALSPWWAAAAMATRASAV